MITRGQIRVFGRPGEEKFRRSAIQNLKKAGETQPTIILPGDDDAAEEPLPFISDEEPMPFADDDIQEEQPLAFAEDDTQQDLSPFSEQDDATDAIMPTVELSAEDAGEQSSDEEHTDVATQEVSLADDDYLILEDDRESAAPTGGRSRRGYSSAGSSDEFEAQPEPAAYIEEETPQPVQTALLGLLSIVLLVSAIVFVGAATGNISQGLVETLKSLGDKLGLI